MRAGAFAVIVAVLIASGQVRAQNVGDADAGRRLATGWCSNCHQVDPGARGSASDAIPSFSSIAERSSTTAMSIRAFLRTSHRTMPNFNLTDTQIDDIGAYILSLRNARSP